MDIEKIFRRVRGAVGNAIVWGIGWGALGLVAFIGLKAAGFLPGSTHWLDSLMVAGRLGFMGGIVGGAFSALIPLLYRGRRLSEISAVRFGLRGGLVAGVWVPGFMLTMNLLSGGGFSRVGLMLDDTLLAAVFGAVTAGGSIALAKRAQGVLPGSSQDRPGLLEGGDRQVPADGWDARRRGAPAWRGAQH